MGILHFSRRLPASPAPRVRITIGARRLGILGVVANCLLLFPESADASENIKLSFLPTADQSANKTLKNSPADPCLSLLSSGPSHGLPDKGQRSAGVTEAAGRAATIGLLLGLNVALGPAEDLRTTHDAKNPARVSALDIARYRTCKKEQALRRHP